MSVGPGKYDDLCAMVRESAGAEGTIVVIFNGIRGHGFSIQASREVCIAIPELLRNVANDIEKDMKIREESNGTQGDSARITENMG